ncbi:MAG: HEAT repeat domain-containing protein, partial [Syntrophobacteraceae bacterium]|nr:HEAT repeat domain-containing protein [Syntrophobacteraceae bacterium]
MPYRTAGHTQRQRQPAPGPAVRRRAADTLGGTEEPRVVEPLIATLKDRNEEVRTAAAFALGRIKAPRAVG